jgi:hypothetical protein
MLPFHIAAVLVLFFGLLKHFRRAQAAFRREVANVPDDGWTGILSDEEAWNTPMVS